MWSPWAPDAMPADLTQPPVVPPFQEDELIVTAPSARLDTVRQVQIYENGVVATYGPTVLRAQKLEVFYAQGQKYGEATGEVVLEDPEGNLRASRLIFRWGDRSGEAFDVALDSGGMVLRAKRIEIQPERREVVQDPKEGLKTRVIPPTWVLYEVEATTCRQRVPLYSVYTPKVTITPGRRGIADRPRFSLFGRSILTLPRQRFSLDRREKGFGLPGVARSRDGRLGVTWSAGFLLNDISSLDFGISSYQRSFPGYVVTYARTFVAPDGNQRPIAPRSEFEERFSFGYFDNVFVDRPEAEEGFYNEKRASLSVSSQWNAAPATRRGDQVFNKPIEIAYERSDTFGPLKAISQARTGLLGQTRGSTDPRSSLTTSILPPRLRLGKNLSLLSRLDAATFGTTEGLYSWFRGQLGLVYEPTSWLRLGAATFGSGEAGNAQFPMDELFSKSGSHLRLDVNLGPTKLSLLNKYDSRVRKWYDREYTASQVVGCLEAFILYRQEPNQYGFGLRLRANEFFDNLRQRNQRRTQPASPPKRTTISRIGEP